MTPAKKQSTRKSKTTKKKTARKPAAKKGGRSTRAGASSGSRKWPTHLIERLHGLRDTMAEQGVDALLVTNERDIHYLTGFPGEDAWLVVGPRQVVCLSDHRFEEELKKQHPYMKSVMRRQAKTADVKKLADRYKWKKVGVQAQVLSVAGRKAVAKELGASRLKDVGDWLLDQRAVKDTVEVRTLREAIRIQEGAFRQLLTQIKPGMSERAICAQLEFNMRAGGGDGPAFATIVGAGPNSSKPHYLPGNRKLRKNEPLLIDFGCLLGGYHSDMTRVVFFGKPSSKMREIYGVVREAMLAGIDKCGPGVPLTEVFKASNDVIKKAGYEKRFRHGLGHGIGLQIHEQPNIGPKSKGELAPGHVVTIEPGIYLPGVGGVRLEDDVLITATGAKNLCTLPTGLESAII